MKFPEFEKVQVIQNQKNSNQASRAQIQHKTIKILSITETPESNVP